jgi:hypothetical protein
MGAYLLASKSYDDIKEVMVRIKNRCQGDNNRIHALALSIEAQRGKSDPRSRTTGSAEGG